MAGKLQGLLRLGAVVEVRGVEPRSKQVALAASYKERELNYLKYYSSL